MARFTGSKDMAQPKSLGQALKSVASNPKARQAGALYASLLLSLALGIAVSVINTRLLGPKAFGDFKLLQTVWTVGVLFVTFGLLTTGGNLLANKESRDTERPLLGSLLVITLMISLLFIASMCAASFPLGRIYGDEFGQNIRLNAGLLFVFPFQIYLQETLRGTNSIYSLSFLNAFPQLAYIPAALAINHRYGFSLDWAILLYLACLALSVLLITIWTKPRFAGVGAGIREVLSRNRAIGSHIYVASLVSTTTAYLGQFTLGYFQDTRQVGEFALALTISMPLTMIPNAIATTFFKHFASVDRIPKKVVMASVGLSVVTLAGFLLIIKALVLLLYTERFSNVVPLTYVCANACVIHGIGDIFSRFLLVHGKTSWLRINAMQLGLISVLGYVLLVEEYGAMGAIYTKFIIAVVYLVTMLIYYQRMQKKVAIKAGELMLHLILRIYNKFERLLIEPFVQYIGKIYLIATGVKFGKRLKLYGLPSAFPYRNSTIVLGNQVTLRSRSKGNAIGVNHEVILRTQSENAFIKIGNRVGISGGAICARNGILIGDDVLIGSNVVIADNDFHPVDPFARMNGEIDSVAKAITIERNVWIGADSYICKGVTIGENSVIGAKSVVTKSIPPNCVAAGVPARVVKTFDSSNQEHSRASSAANLF